MTRKAWTMPEVTMLRQRYPHEPTAVLAAELGRTRHAVYMAANGFGLRKTAERLAAIGEVHGFKERSTAR